MNLNIEELSLLSVFSGGSRESAAEEIRSILKADDNGDLVPVAESVIKKLEAMTDEEYAELDFTDVEEVYE